MLCLKEVHVGHDTSTTLPGATSVLLAICTMDTLKLISFSLLALKITWKSISKSAYDVCEKYNITFWKPKDFIFKHQIF